MKYMPCTHISGRAQGAVVMFHGSMKMGRGETELVIEVSADQIIRIAEALKAQTPVAHNAAGMRLGTSNTVTVVCRVQHAQKRVD